jgi:predicted ABC-type ATPase
MMLVFPKHNTPDEAIARVAQRVKQGGHDIPEATIRRRFASGLRNLVQHYAPVVDEWVLYDNSGDAPVLLEWGEK